MENFDVTVIGAGVVGLAICATCPSCKGLVVEQHEGFGKETSSRNSEVIHAGIYYPTDSLKARMCIEGKYMLYELCKENNINYKNTGKIIVATNKEEESDLEGLYKQGLINGVNDLKIINKKEIKKMEPNINALSGIYSPSTGIVDTHNVMKCYEAKSKQNGFTFAYGCKLVRVEKQDSGFRIAVLDVDGESYEFMTKILVNSAGLESDKVAEMVGIKDYKIHYCKGEYFRVGGGKNKYINRLIYPHPTETSLGIHTVIDLQGEIKLGPNAFYVDRIDYDVDNNNAQSMYESVKTYLPFIESDDLSPDMSGIRPKLQAPGEHVRDFVIEHEKDRGLYGFINLIGIESPGFTSAPAIAKYVTNMECFSE